MIICLNFGIGWISSALECPYWNMHSDICWSGGASKWSLERGICELQGVVKMPWYFSNTFQIQFLALSLTDWRILSSSRCGNEDKNGTINIFRTSTLQTYIALQVVVWIILLKSGQWKVSYLVFILTVIVSSNYVRQ